MRRIATVKGIKTPHRAHVSECIVWNFHLSKYYFHGGFRLHFDCDITKLRFDICFLYDKRLDYLQLAGFVLMGFVAYTSFDEIVFNHCFVLIV